MQGLRAIEHKVEKLRKINFDNYQSYAWLSMVAVGTELEFSNGVTSKKVSENDTTMEFLVHIPPETVFPLHWHDCDEKIKVVSGSLMDKEMLYHITMGQSVMIPKATPHQPYTLEKDTTIVIVRFKKSNP
jgi:uncharacterized RmlC-like cupin family protein